jgi:drug/metabolite transporter (DMT)-like permease
VNGLAITLIIVAAFLHATWNLLAKRIGAGEGFLWLMCIGSAVIYAPVAAWIFFTQHPQIGLVQIMFMTGTAVLHLAYFVLLTRGYRLGDLSLIYPLARGTGPALSTAAAIAFFGERPTWLALMGAVLVVVGVFVLTSGPQGARKSTVNARWAVGYGILTGVMIAAYTLWDKQAVSAFRIPPLILDWGSSLLRFALLTPVAIARWDDVRLHWRAHRLETLAIAFMAPLAYIMVLTALVFTPVSYVAPAREMSIVIGTAMGTRLLAEEDGRRRLLGAVAIVMGVLALAIG